MGNYIEEIMRDKEKLVDRLRETNKKQAEEIMALQIRIGKLEQKELGLGVHDLAQLVDALEQLEGKQEGNQAPWGYEDNSLLVAIEERERFCEIIYGEGGHRRYQLRADGFVYFSEAHSSGPEKTNLAKKLGFKFCNKITKKS